MLPGVHSTWHGLNLVLIPLCTSSSTSASYGSSGKDTGVLDAARVPPSVFAEQMGEPTVMHDDPTHDRSGRHGRKVGDDLAKYGGGQQ